MEELTKKTDSNNIVYSRMLNFIYPSFINYEYLEFLLLLTSVTLY